MTPGSSSHDRDSRQGDPLGPAPETLTDEDLTAAMKQVSGYLDITTGDLKELYKLAYVQARKRILSIQAREIMTSPVHTVEVDLSVNEVAALMAEAQVAGVPVVDPEKRVVGVISEKDFLHRMSEETGSFMGLVATCMARKGCPALSIKGHVAEDIMSAPAVTVEPQTPLHEIFSLMSGKRINRVPVLEKGVLLGIVSRDDVLLALTAVPEPEIE